MLSVFNTSASSKSLSKDKQIEISYLSSGKGDKVNKKTDELIQSDPHQFGQVGHGAVYFHRPAVPLPFAGIITSLRAS